MGKRVIHGDVAGPGGQPLADADVSPYWRVNQGRMVPVSDYGTRTDEAGRFQFAIGLDDPVCVVLAVDPGRQIGGMTRIDPAAEQAVKVEAGPLTHEPIAESPQEWGLARPGRYW